MRTIIETRLQIAAPLLLWVAACVHQGEASRTSAPAPTQAPPVENAPRPAPAPPAAPATTPAPVAAESPPTVPHPAAPAGAAPPAPRGRASPATPGPTSTPSREVPAAPRAAPGPAPSAPAATPPAAARAAPAPAPPAAALDLAGLEQRLRDTHAIGVFTKLSLKNQVDDLLTQFRAYYQGGSKVTLAQLRQKYEVLLIKVVTLLQDGDPPLATAISSSREAIWNVLTDPKKFANI